MNANDVMLIHDVRTDRPTTTADGLLGSADENARKAEYEDVLSRVKTLLIEQLHLQREPDEIDPDSVLFGTGLGLDSVDAVELTVAIETEFGVRIPDSEASRRIFRTVSSVVDHLLKIKGSVTHVA